MGHPAAVVLPADRPGALGIVRSLGRRGIPVYALDSDPHAAGLCSRYARPCTVPDEPNADSGRLETLMTLGQRLSQKAVLYPVSDDAVLLCSRERSSLQQYYHFVMPEHAAIVSLLTKDGLTRIGEACGLDVPRMVVPANEDEVSAVASDLLYPVILKPVVSPSWLRPEIISLLRDHPLSGPPKVAVCRDREELLKRYREVSAYDNRMIIQEVIPGEDDRLVYFCFYLDRQSRPLASFAGRKHRVLPVGFGSASYVRSFRDPQLEEVSLRLLRFACYQGLGGIEFKQDSRDRRYKLIEFNARFGMWDSLSIRCGVDIPYIAYRDALGLPVLPQSDYREGVAWIDFQRDVRAFLIYRSKGELTFSAWAKSLRGEKDWAVWSVSDPRPALAESLKLLDRPIAAARTRLGADRHET